MVTAEFAILGHDFHSAGHLTQEFGMRFRIAIPVGCFLMFGNDHFLPWGVGSTENHFVVIKQNAADIQGKGEIKCGSRGLTNLNMT